MMSMGDTSAVFNNFIMIRYYLCFLLLGLASAAPLSQNVSIHMDMLDLKEIETILNERYGDGDDTVITAKVNKYADKLIANIDSFMGIQQYDPMDMPGITEKFSKFLVSGEFTLKDGVMTGASTLHREGDCIMTYNKENKYLKIDVPLAFSELKFTYNYRVKYMHIGPTGKVDGGVTKIKMRVVIGINYNTYMGSLDKYEILNSGLTDGSTFIATTNDFADKLMTNFDQMVLRNGLDPLTVPDIGKKISHRVLLITYSGSLNLTRINLKDFSKIKRQGDAKITYNKNTKKLTIDIPMTFNKINFDCHYRARIMGLGPNGRLNGGMKNIRMITSIEIDLNNWQASVSKYKITHSGHISVHFHQFILVNWLINLLANTTTTIFKGLIIHVINSIVGGTLQSVVDVINTLISDFINVSDAMENSTVMVYPIENIRRAINAFDMS